MSLSKTLVTLKFKTKLYSQTGCSFDCNLATFGRNIDNLIDSLNGASCNPRGADGTVFDTGFKFSFTSKLRILRLLWLTYIAIVPLRLRKGNE